MNGFVIERLKGLIGHLNGCDTMDESEINNRYNKLVLVIDALVKTIKELEERIENLENK